MPTPVPRGRRGHRLASQDGSSPVTAVGGLVVFLGFLFLVVQATVHLYASTTAGGVAVEAATRAAQQGGDCGDSIAWAQRQVGNWANRFTCGDVGDGIEFGVHGDSPAATMRVFSAVTGLDSINRRAWVRREVGIDGPA